MNASNTQHIGNLISIVYVTDDPVFRPGRQDDFIPSYVLPLQACNGSGELRIDEIQACGTQDGGRKIDTPWVLFMEADEFLDQTNWNVLKEHCRYNNQSAARLSVQRFLPKERMKVFSWVTTSAIWQNATAEKRIYVSRETRLVPASLLGEARIASQCSGPNASFLIQIEARDETVCEAILSRELPPVAPDADPKPEDREIFRHGHQKFVDDRVYSEQFVWPHTVYHTIRYDHIFSIKEALRAGLSNPEIVAYTLIYLLRFRHFSEATEIMKMIPEHWYVRYPDLVNAAATLYFINGNPDRAIDVCRKILEIYPDSDWIAWNAIKLNILSNRYEAIDVILEDYRKATGKELDDSYLAEFRAVHGSSPQRTATVSVCMIVQNEENTLERAITSVKPFADELIVVDTGSRDNSVMIAESLGARVYHLPWSDDFSEARNFAIKQATCDYIFMLDGDEFISPFFFIESQTLLKLCPLEKPIAFAFQIGTYFNETDWLFVVQEEGNFRIENTSVRVFPRIPGIEYSGRILERIEPALNKLGIPIRIIPDKMMQLVHEHGSRRERVSRKAPIYKMLKDPGEEEILSAIRDFSFLGKTGETAEWLKLFMSRPIDKSIKIKMGLNLAKLLESSDPPQAEYLYRDLVQKFPESREAVLSYAEFLIVNNRTEEISGINFNSEIRVLGSDGQTERDLRCLESLKYFKTGQREEAFQILTEVLKVDAFQVFPQALRFYYMTSLNEIEGAVSALDVLFTLTGSRKDFHIEKIEDVFTISGELYSAMLESSFQRESAIILQGIMKLGEFWRL